MSPVLAGAAFSLAAAGTCRTRALHVALTARPAYVCGLFIADVDAKSFVLGLDCFQLNFEFLFMGCWIEERLMVVRLSIGIKVYILFEMAV